MGTSVLTIMNKHAYTHTQIPALAKLLEVQLSLLVAFSNGMKFPFFLYSLYLFPP